jgi:hypothetical protein
MVRHEFDWIRKWVPVINARFCKSENNPVCIEYFEKLVGIAEFEDHGDFYLVWLITYDECAKACLNVISCGTNGASVRSFIEMQKRIEEIAKEMSVDFILQGSDMTEKYNRYLEKICGYKPQIFRKEVES